jgi:hypothetical protein
MHSEYSRKIEKVCSLGENCCNTQYERQSINQISMDKGSTLFSPRYRQLRHVHLHPTAPLLFVSILRKTRATADLIPLLVEPLRSVLQGLGVRARAQHPQHALAFLMALREVARAALEEAQEVLGEASEGLGEVLGAHEHARSGIGLDKNLREVSGVLGDGDQAGGLPRAGEGVAEASGVSKEGESGPEARQGEGASGRATSGEGRGLPHGLGETGARDEGWWEVHKRRREAAAEVACSAVDACAPLMGSKSIQNR